MHSNAIEAYKEKLKLTDYQRNIIVGKLLGDGHLETRDKKTYRLKIEHSSKQKEYVDWLYEQFKTWVRQAPKMRVRQYRFPQGTCGEKASYGFTTYSHGAFRFYNQQFYTKEKKKVMPKLIAKLLTPVSVAIWYLDDGSFKSDRHKTFIIHTHGYTKRDLQRVRQAFLKFGVEVSLHRQNYTQKTYWRIYVLSQSAETFKKLIEPTVLRIPAMRYKLGNKMPKK
jgi:hypothetical protein